MYHSYVIFYVSFFVHTDDSDNNTDHPSFGLIIFMPVAAILALIITIGICCTIRVASRHVTRPCLPEWAASMIWNRPLCGERSNRMSHTYAAVPGSEPWAPRTARTLPENQITERDQHVLSYYLRRQTYPSEPCRTPPPPSYRAVVQNLDNFPVPPGVGENGVIHRSDSVDEMDLPSYNNVMSEYPEARHECFNMQPLSRDA